jgi:hypothetical protein
LNFYCLFYCLQPGLTTQYDTFLAVCVEPIVDLTDPIIDRAKEHSPLNLAIQFKLHFFAVEGSFQFSQLWKSDPIAPAKQVDKIVQLVNYKRPT